MAEQGNTTKRTLTTEIQLNFEQAINNVREMAQALQRLNQNAGFTEGIIDVKALEQQLRSLRSLLGREKGEITVSGFERLKKSINNAVREAIDSANVWFDPKELAEILKLRISRKATNALRSSLQEAIADALKSPELADNLKFNITIPERGLKSLNEALNSKLTQLLAENVDFSDINVATDNGNIPVSLKITPDNMQKLVNAVRDKFFELFASERIIQFDNIGDIQPFTVDVKALREVILKIQTALTNIGERLDKEFEALNIKDLDAVAVDLSKFKLAISQTVIQVQRVANLLNQLKVDQLSEKQLTELENTIKYLHASLVTRVKGALSDVVSKVRFPRIGKEGSEEISRLMEGVNSIIKNYISNEVDAAIDSLRAVLGLVQVDVDGKNMLVRGVGDLLDRFSESMRAAIQQIPQDSNFGFDVSDIINSLNAFGTHAKQRVNDVMNAELDKLVNLYVAASQNVMDEIQKAITRVASFKFSEQEIAESRIGVDIPVEELRKVVAPKLQDVINRMVRSMTIDRGEEVAVGATITIPKSAINELKRTVREIITSYVTKTVEQVRGQDSEANVSDVRKFNSLVRTETTNLTNLIVEKTRAVIRVFLEGINDSSLSIFPAAEQKMLQESVQTALTNTAKSMVQAVRVAFDNLIESGVGDSAAIQKRLSRIATGVDSVLVRYVNHLVESAKEINKEFALSFAIPTRDLHPNIRRMLVNQMGFKSIRQLEKQFPRLTGDKAFEDMYIATLRAVLDEFNSSLIRSMNSYFATLHQAIVQEVQISPVDKDAFVQNLTGQMNRLMQEIVRKMGAEVTKQFEQLTNQIRGLSLEQIVIGEHVSNQEARRRVRPTLLESSDLLRPSGSGVKLPLGYTEFDHLTAYEKMALINMERVRNRFRDSKLTQAHKDLLNQYLEEWYSRAREAVSDLQLGLELGDKSAYSQFRSVIRDLNLELKYTVEQFRKLLSEDKLNLRGTMLARDEALKAARISPLTLRNILESVEALKGFAVTSITVNDKTGSWSAAVRDLEGNMIRLRGVIDKVTGELYQHGEALSFVAKKQQDLYSVTLGARSAFDYATAYGIAPEVERGVTRMSRFITSVINTIRYITAGAIIGTPTWMLHSGYTSYKDFEYEMKKAVANFLIEDPTMLTIAAQRLVQRGELPSDRNAAVRAIRAEADELLRAVTGGLDRLLQDLAYYYGVGLADVGSAFQIASRRIDDPFEAFMFTREVTKLRSIEEVDVEEAAMGLEAIVSQWNIAGQKLSDMTNMLIKAANISQAKVEDLLATQQRVGSLLRNAMPQSDIDTQLAASIALSSIFVQATARSGAEAGTFLRNIVERAYRPENVRRLKEISEQPQIRALGVDLSPFDEEGNQRDIVDVLGAAFEAARNLRSQDRMKLINYLASLWHRGSVEAFRMFFEDFEKQLQRIQATNIALQELNIGEGIDPTVTKTDMTATEVIRTYVESIRNATVEDVARIQAATMDTYKFRQQQVRTMWDAAVGETVKNLSDEFDSLTMLITSLLRGIRNNADMLAQLLHTMTTVGLAIGARWLLFNKLPEVAENRRRERLTDRFNEITRLMVERGRSIDVRRQLLERNITPENAPRLAPQMAQVAAEAIMFNKQLDVLQRTMHELGIKESELSVRAEKVQTSFKGMEIDSRLVEKELRNLSEAAGVTERTFAELQARMERMHRMYQRGLITLQQYHAETTKIQREFLNADAGLPGYGGSSMATAMLLAAGAGAGAATLLGRSRGVIQRLKDAWEARKSGQGFLAGLFGPGVFGGRGAIVRDASGKPLPNPKTGGPLFEADLMKQLDPNWRPPTWLGRLGKLAGTVGRFARFNLYTIIGSFLVEGLWNRFTRMGAPEAELFESDVLKAIEMIRMIEKSRNAGFFEDMLIDVKTLWTRGINWISGSEANDLFLRYRERILKGEMTEQQAIQELMVEQAKARMRQMDELFEIDPNQKFRYDESGQLTGVKYSSITTMEEANELISGIMDRLNLELGLLSSDYELRKARSLIGGLRENSEEVIRLTEDFLQKQIELLQNAAEEVKAEIEAIEAEGGAGTPAYKALQVQYQELMLQAEQARLEMTQNQMEHFNRIMSDLDFRLQQAQLQGAIRRADLLLAGNREDSPLVKRLEAELAKELNAEIARQLPLLRAELQKYAPDTEEYRKIWLQILQLQVDQKENLVKIRETLTNSLSTFNLPPGISPMTFYESLVEKGTHRNISLIRGDTIINITVGNVNDRRTINEIADAVRKVVNEPLIDVSRSLSNDVKRLGVPPYSPIGGGRY